MFEAIMNFFRKTPEPERASMVFFQRDMPTGRHYQMGDLWYQLGDSGRVDKQHVWTKHNQWKEIHLEGDK